MENDEQGKRKIHNPIYVPVIGLGELLNLSKRQLEMRIIHSIEYNSDNNTFTYKPR